uniref:TIAM Rac1 associated GEF 2a n=1 Tax=Dicentrarchus labrax TaxID=13489 RepID=A0A8C4IJD8_DICLA
VGRSISRYSHSSFVAPAKPSCALRFSSRREEVPSARSWWRSSQGGSRSRGRSYQHQHAAGPPYTSWHYEHAPKATRGGAKLGAGSPQRYMRGERAQGGCRNQFGYLENGVGSNGERMSLESGGSPKVLLSKDGSMRVEFTNARVGAMEPQATAAATTPVTEPSLRTSKGSSLSSDGSWYDSPWGTGGELADNVFVCGESVANSSGYTTYSSSRTEESATASNSSLQQQQRTAFSSTALLDDVIQEEEGSGGGVEQRYSSLTLPCRRTEPDVTAASAGNSRKDFLKSRIRRLSDWTGSLSRKKRRIQEPHGSDTSDIFVNRLDSGSVGCGTLWSSNPLHALNQNQNQNQFPAVHCGSSRSLNQSGDLQRQNVYENFMQELETEGREEEMDGEVEVGGGEQLDVLFEKEQGVVRRAGWLSFKALITVSKDRKLELVARRKWRHFWVTLKGCTLLFYETYGKNMSAEQELSPRYALLADDSIVQAVPEHPRREHVFCLSNSHGDVYLFQATNQTDLENWVTAIHSASASLLAKRQGKEDTLRLLRCQSRSLLHKIDMDGKMKKMAELQLSVIKEQKNRKAVESQILQWEQNLEKLNLDLFRLRCYLSSLQGSELPNPKSLLAVASRPSKSMLGRLGVFSVSSFHALVRTQRALSPLSLSLSECMREASCLIYSTVSSGSCSCFPSGLRAGDEVLAVNGAAVSGLDLDLMQSLFSHQKLQLLLRRDESPEPEEPAATTTLWPSPCQPPAPLDLQTWTTSTNSGLYKQKYCILLTESPNVDRVYSLYQTFPESRAAEADVPRNPYSREVGLQPTSPAHLSVCQRLRKVIQELVDTEKSYVKDLVCLFDIYLTPLQKETFLSKEEMEALFGSLPEMLDFQRVFLQTLEEKIASCPNFSTLETPGQFKKLLFSLGGSFLYYADHFKHYSGFCANHIKVQKVLERAKTDGAFKHFLEARNPTNQHSSSLESYLIKPVQRVLKYPLLLRELVSLTDPESPEHAHLTEALRAMEKVASHINEMQKIYEDYGSVFDQLAAEQSGPHKQVTEISMGEFLVHSSVVWLNPLPSLGRLRKEPELTLFVFKRAVILVYRESAKLKKRMTGSRSADLDPFRFRWLIPVSAVQVRPANITGSENPCVWELVHSRSEVEGRPETVFQLCSRLNFTEEEEAERGAAASHSDDRRNEETRRSFSLRRSPGGEVLDMERDFSVQSLTSMINEDCFYDSMLGMQKAAVPTLQG